MGIISRRNFIAGVAACGGLCGFRTLAGTFGTGKPNAKIGIISDLHVRYEPETGTICSYSDASTVKHAFEYFRDQNVDAVVITGDLTDYGQIREIQEVANKWFEVFPNNKAPDGHTVEKIFVIGNHEWDCFTEDVNWMRSRYGADTREGCLRNVLRGDPAARWQAIWGEPFEPVYHKKVKGYSFIGVHWIDDDSYSGAERFHRIIPFIQANKAAIDMTKPLFHVQHPHPKDTVFTGTFLQDYGAVAAGYAGMMNNLVCLTGHSHYSITDERSIWQGDYTAINCGCLRWTFPPTDFIQAPGWANAASYYQSAQVDPHKLMPQMWADWTSRQGLLMEIYDDCLVFHRRDFYADLPLGDAWVVPTGPGAAKPYTPARQRAETPAPQFPAGASLTVTQTTAKTRGGVTKAAVKVCIPQANAVAKGRPFTYDVAVVSDTERVALKPAVDIGFNHGPANSTKQIPMDYLVALEELPAGRPFTFEVTPRGWFNQAGNKLVSSPVTLTTSTSIEKPSPRP